MVRVGITGMFIGVCSRAANRDNGPDGPPSRGMTMSHDQPDVLPQSFDTSIVVLFSASPPPLRVGYSRRTGTGVRKLTCSFSVIIYSLSSSQYYLPPQLHVCQDGLVTLIRRVILHQSKLPQRSSLLKRSNYWEKRMFNHCVV